MKKGFTIIKKVLSLIMAFAMILTLMPTVALAAEDDTKTIYLNAGGSNLWDRDGAWFAAWVWGSTQQDAWYRFTDDDADGIYSAEVPADATNCKFVRMNPAHTEPNWEGVWNRTGDLTIGDNNCFKLTGWDAGTWSTQTVAPVYTVAGVSGLCGSNWDIADAANDMTAKAGTNLYEKVFTNVAAGTYEFKIVVNHSWDTSWGNNGGNVSVAVAESDSTVTVTFNPATRAISATVTAPEKVEEYTVTFNGTNVTSDGAAKATGGSEYTATLSAVDGYTLPKSITVTMGGDAVADAYNADTGKITIANVTGDITINAVGLKVHAVTFNGTNVTSDGAAKVTEGSGYTAVLTAAQGYTLPESITVKTGDAEVAHTYNKDTGALSIEASAISGDISITAEGVAETVTVYFKNNWLWTDVKVHYWGGQKSGTTWPGMAMTLVENDGSHDIYSAEIPSDVDGFQFNGIKNDGSGNRDQSPDLTDFAEGKAYYMYWENGNKVYTEDYSPNSKPTDSAYYLVGYINGADYNGTDYQFADGSLTATFTQASYVVVKDSSGDWYMAESYCEGTSVELKRVTMRKCWYLPVWKSRSLLRRMTMVP